MYKIGDKVNWLFPDVVGATYEIVATKKEPYVNANKENRFPPDGYDYLIVIVDPVEEGKFRGFKPVPEAHLEPAS
jgi:hypothetical protein